MIHAYIGDGKGKSTAALGLAVRAFGAGMRVALVYFDKGCESYKHHELVVLDKLGVTYWVTGLERMSGDGSFRFGVSDGDKKEALRGFEIAKDVLVSKNYDLLVLDELLSAVTFGLLPAAAVSELFGLCDRKIELVLTGRCSDETLLEGADLVSRIVKVKHYFDAGIKARPGIEY